MDLKAYYRKLREAERGIHEEFVVVKSLATPDGGTAGRLTEVTRAGAARLLVDGAAELARAEETAAYRQSLAEEQTREQERRAATQIQVRVVADDLRAAVRAGRKGRKE